MQDLSEEIIQVLATALEGTHRQFEFIRSLKMFFKVKKYYKLHLKACEELKKAMSQAFNDYLSCKQQGIDRLDLLIAFTQIRQCVTFYKEEARILKDSMKEYVCYIHNNHLIATLFGKVRPEEDLVDWRKIPISFW